jgi:hypothetical protein
VPAAVGDIAMRALRHNPDERFATAAEMQAAMEKAMVTANVPATTLDVAAFAGEFLVDRATARKQTLELALSAARERERVTHLLQPTEVDVTSGSGIVDVGTYAGRFGSLTPPTFAMDGAPSSRDRDDDLLTVPLLPLATPTESRASSARARDHVQSVVVAAGAATEDDAPRALANEPLTALTMLSVGRRRKNMTLLVGGVFGGLGVLAVGMLVAMASSASGGPLLVAKPAMSAWRALATPATPRTLSTATTTLTETAPSAEPSATVVMPKPAAMAPPRWTAMPMPLPAAHPTPSATSAAKKPRIDDGF